MDSNLLAEFVLEAKAHIAAMEAGLLRLEEGEGDEETINGIFRAAHSIKGTASFFELNKIVELAHVLEDVFGKIRDRELEAKPQMVDSLLAAADVLSELVNHPAVSDNYDTAGVVAAVRHYLPAAQPQQAAPAAAGEPSAWELWNQLTGSEASGEAVMLPAGNATTACRPDLPAGTAVPAVRQPAGKPPEVIIGDSVRVNVGLLNDLLALAGEMVLRRNQLLRLVQDVGRQAAQFEVVANGIDELTTQMQRTIMQTRMQPISYIFNKFPRIVRDLSRKVGKEADLSMQGMNVELDRSLLEALVDPMTHLVRNALDHGIELPEVRAANNKPAAGSLVLHAYHENGRVIIDICDDGTGLDYVKIKAKAVQLGLATEKQVAAMTEAEVYNFIMAPGFSTAEEVTDLSGRGVGMDVVRTNIEKLGGKIELLSESGKGTTIRLILPLTLAIISALLVVANDQTFAIPQANVRELLLIQPGEQGEKQVELVQGRLALRLRGKLLPLVMLGEILADREPGAEQPQTGLTAAILRVLVVKSGSQVYGLAVDAVYDIEEILVKPLTAALGSCGLYSGMTVLGDGSIAMILDTESLRVQAKIAFAGETALLPASQELKAYEQEKQSLLLFTCSGGEILGLDLAMVSRVEAVELSKLQRIGAKHYVAFQGQTTRVIRPEHYLPLARRKNKLDKVYIILPKMEKYSIGIIAEHIYDTVFTEVALDKDGVFGTGILGSALLDGKVVTLVNMHELFVAAAPEYYQSLAAGKRPGVRPSQEGPRLRVLLVEDMPFFLRVVKSYLESDGYEVITATNGREAWEILNRSKVELVVSDIEMPLMNGIELVRAIRAAAGLRQLPVVALTSLTGEEYKEKGLRAGFDRYEYKLDRVRLLDSLREVLQSKA